MSLSKIFNYSYSILPSLSLDGIISVSIVHGSFNYDLFGSSLMVSLVSVRLLDDFFQISQQEWRLGLVDYGMSTVHGFWGVLVNFVGHDVMWKGQEREKVYYKMSICFLMALCTACAATVETTVMTNQYTYLNLLKGSFPICVLVLSQ